MSGDGLSTTNTANAWLNVLRGNNSGTFTAPTALYIQLHTGDPGASGTANVSVGSATRNTFVYAAASGGSQSLVGGTAPGNWTNGGTTEVLTDITIWSASTSGTFYYSVGLTSSQSWSSGNTFTLTSLSVSLSPLAS